MRTPRYQAERFTDSGWDSGTATRKARFVNALLRFIADGCPREKFTPQLYKGLSTHGLLRLHRALRHPRLLRRAAIHAPAASLVPPRAAA